MSFLERIKWQDVLMSVVILAYLMLQSGLIGGFKQLPSPLYGGDYYYQLGAVNHIRYGGDPLGGTNLLEGGPGYFPVYPFLVAAFANAFGLESIRAMLVFSSVLLVASMALVYLFITSLFGNRTLAVMGTIAYLPPSFFPLLKYTEFSYAIAAPFFFWALLNFIRKVDARSAVLLGLAYGLGALSHGILFIFLTFVLAIFFLYFGVAQNLTRTEGRLGFRKDGRFFKFAALAFLIGFAIGQLYWFEPIFKYHGKTLNSMENLGQDYSKGMWTFFAGTLQWLLFRFSPGPILGLFGIALILLLKKHSLETRFVGVLFVAYLAGIFHHFVTIPLLGVHFVPNYMLYLGRLSMVLLSLISLHLAARIKGVGRYVPMLTLVLLVVFAYNGYSDYRERLKNDKWLAAGANELPPQVAAAADWIRANTGVDDVFLTTNELGFAMNAVTGRKLLSSRKSQNYPFIDVEQRAADAAIIFYGNNGTLRKELIGKYKVKYLYWDYYWVQSEYQFDGSGRLAGTFDPLFVFDTEKYREYLSSNNVTYFPLHTWADPALRGDNIRQYDLLFVVPAQWDWQHPWSGQLDPDLKEVWSYSEGGQVISRIYEVTA